MVRSRRREFLPRCSHLLPPTYRNPNIYAGSFYRVDNTSRKRSSGETLIDHQGIVKRMQKPRKASKRSKYPRESSMNSSFDEWSFGQKHSQRVNLSRSSARTNGARGGIQPPNCFLFTTFARHQLVRWPLVPTSLRASIDTQLVCATRWTVSALRTSSRGPCLVQGKILLIHSEIVPHSCSVLVDLLSPRDLS